MSDFTYQDASKSCVAQSQRVEADAIRYEESGDIVTATALYRVAGDLLGDAVRFENKHRTAIIRKVEADLAAKEAN